MIRERPPHHETQHLDAPEIVNEPRVYIPSMSLKDHTLKQIQALGEADSVTIDPHKSGYCSYPAGGLVCIFDLDFPIHKFLSFNATVL